MENGFTFKTGAESPRVGPVLIFLTMGLLVSAIAWSYFTNMPEVTRAAGEISPLGELRKLDHFDGGLVREIYVSAGDRTRKGDPIVLIEQPNLKSEKIEIEEQVTEVEGEINRIRTILTAMKQLSGAGEQRVALAGDENDFANAQFELYAARLDSLETRITHEKRGMHAADRVRENAKARLDVAVSRRARINELFEKGLLSQAAFVAQMDEIEGISSEYLEANLRFSQAEGDYLDAIANFDETALSLREQTLSELHAAQKQRAQLATRVRELNKSQTRATVRSPVDGIIQEFDVLTIGQVIQPGGQIGTLIAADDELIAKVRIIPRDIGHIDDDAEVRIKLTTFDARRYGDLSGRIKSISPTSILDEKGESHFIATIILESDTIGEGNNQRIIRAGMEVSAEIITRNRSLLQYFLKPLERVVSVSFGER
ncbi:MAG: HlyD family type I secretion periplasmic adaptor subunit [Litoreibacter sp.]